MNSILQALRQPISGKRLSIFRIVFGLFMCYEMLDYIKIKLIVVGLLQPGILFNYSPFDFLEPLPVGPFRFLILLMLLANICVVIGFHTKKASFFFFVSYLYILLLEKAYYNNHIYLFVLLAFLLSIVDSDEYYSVSKMRSTEAPRTIPRWQLFAIQLQIIIAYVYGGITKLGYDWIVRFEPIRSSSKAIPDDAWYSFIKTEGGLMFYIYAGTMLDLIIAPLLFHKKLKWIVAPMIILFNVTNSSVFNDIGIFPYLMLCSLVLYFDANDLSKIFTGITSTKLSDLAPAKVTKPWLSYFMVCFLIFQLTFPFRGHFMSENMDWTGIHQSFSWRMKSMARDIKEMQWIVKDGNGQTIPITHGQMINNLQTDIVARNAQAVLDFARYIKAEALKRNVSDPKVYARIMVSFNGRPAQLFVKPDVDLSDPAYTIDNIDRWLMPLKE